MSLHRMWAKPRNSSQIIRLSSGHLVKVDLESRGTVDVPRIGHATRANLAVAFVDRVCAGGRLRWRSDTEQLAAAPLVPCIRSGDSLREHVRNGTPPGGATQSYVEGRELVPHDLASDPVLPRLIQPETRRDAILNGFPHTVWQPETLDTRLHQLASRVGAILLLDFLTEVVVARLAGLWRTLPWTR